MVPLSCRDALLRKLKRVRKVGEPCSSVLSEVILNGFFEGAGRRTEELGPATTRLGRLKKKEEVTLVALSCVET